MPFEHSWKIYAGDTDYSGRIYTPVVVDYVIMTLQEMRDTVGFSNQRFEKETYYPPARNVDIDYLDAIRTDDNLRIQVRPVFGTTSVTYNVAGYVADTAVFEGSLTTVFIDKESEKPIPVPEEYKQEMGRYS